MHNILRSFWTGYVGSCCFGDGSILFRIREYPRITCRVYLKVQQRPFVNFYAPIFVLYELSSPFLNIHWACDKLGLTGSIYQLINGIVLVIVFFGARLCFGTYQTYLVTADILTAVRSSNVELASYMKSNSSGPGSVEVDELLRYYTPAAVPIWLPIVYVGSNTVLNILNWYWFGKMVTTIKSRFVSGADKPEAQKQVKNHDVGHATSVQVKDDTRKRRA